MLPHRQRELATGNNFTFSNPTSKETGNSPNHSDEMEYHTWAERIKGQYNHFGKPNDTKFGAWTRRAPRKDNPDEGEFRWLAKTEEDEGESGTPSPELWKQTGPPAIQSADSSPVRTRGNHDDRDGRFNHISHSARAQTIAKYRQEMLDLVRGMPETAYELSLRDIVESPKITTPLQETVEDKSEEVKDENEKKKKKKKEKKGERRMSRSESMETGGLFLKMSIPKVPSVLGGRKSTGSSPCAKVSPKPTSGDEEKGADREWWNAEFGQMTSSSGSSNSSNSSGSRRRRSNRKLLGCYPFFQTR